jgi:hypothetical protein
MPVFQKDVDFLCHCQLDVKAPKGKKMNCLSSRRLVIRKIRLMLSSFEPKRLDVPCGYPQPCLAYSKPVRKKQISSTSQ